MLTKDDYFLYLSYIRGIYIKQYHKPSLGHGTSSV